MDSQPSVMLSPWTGPWSDDDPDANFKSDVALYSRLDPLTTITNLANAIDVPVGSVCRYILAKWASAGSEALMTLGATALNRLGDVIDQAEAADTDEARLEAYENLKTQLSWLRAPLDNPDLIP